MKIQEIQRRPLTLTGGVISLETAVEAGNGIYQDNDEITAEMDIKEDDLCLPALITLRAESGCSLDFEAMAYCEDAP